MLDYLITGGFGFQGFHLTRSLLEDGASVRVLARDSEHAWRNFQILSTKKNLRAVWGDCTNFETVRTAVRDCKTVIHLAAQINVDESILHPERSLACNVMGTCNVLDAVKLCGAQLILASSCEVYGTALSELMDESHPINPRSPYAACKAAADRIAYSYNCSYGLPLVICRPGNVYGWGQKGGATGAVIARWMQRAMSGQDIEVYGDGSQGRDFINVADVIAGYRAIIRTGISKLSGMTFNLGTGVNTPMSVIASVIAELGGAKVTYGPARPGEVKAFALDSRKAREFLGWSATVSIKEGLQHTWEEAQKRGGF